MGKVNNENYVMIQGWMIKELGLKGNDLMVYAIIYGFSQDGTTKFTGGLQYLADWTNSTKRGVIKNLKSLLDKGFIEKEEKYINGVKFCEYHVTKFTEVVNKVHLGSEQSSPNNINNNTNNNKDIYSRIPYAEIVDYLNEKCGTDYKSTTKKTQDAIKARFNEGFSVDDFKKVIDTKSEEWLNDSYMCKFLRPETLFSPKFEGYLNQKKAISKGGIEIDNKFRSFLAQNEVVDFGI